jgi:hypothetical protein
MDRSHFYEANKTGLILFRFSMIFGDFYNIFVFIEKEKNEKKEKGLHGLGPVHNEASPTARIQPMLKKSPLGEAHLDVNILHQEP